MAAFRPSALPVFMYRDLDANSATTRFITTRTVVTNKAPEPLISFKKQSKEHRAIEKEMKRKRNRDELLKRMNSLPE